MAGFNYAQNIIGLDKVKGDIHELEVDVANLSASVLTISGDVDELELSVADLSASVLAIGGEVDELELSISQLSASTLPYSGEQSTKQKIDEVNEKVTIGTPNAGESYTSLIRGQYVRIGNLVTVSAIISVNTNLTSNYLLLGNLPTVADNNSNVGFANPEHTETNTNPITIRMYEKGLHTNKANELLANKIYYLSAMYITSDN